LNDYNIVLTVIFVPSLAMTSFIVGELGV